MNATLTRVSKLPFFEFKERRETAEFTKAFESIDYQNSTNAKLISILAVRQQKPFLEAHVSRPSRGRGRTVQDDASQAHMNLSDFD